MTGRETAAAAVAGRRWSAGRRKPSGIDDACAGVRRSIFSMEDQRRRERTGEKAGINSGSR